MSSSPETSDSLLSQIKPTTGEGQPGIGPGQNIIQTPFGPVDTFLLGQRFNETCLFKMGMGGVAGLGLGLMFGLFLSSGWEFQPLQPGANRTIGVKATLREMKNKSFGMAKQFGVISSVYAGSECLFQAFRGKHDVYNAANAGCLTGAVLGRKAGPKAAIMGCAGFAAFSTAVELYMQRDSD